MGFPRIEEVFLAPLAQRYKQGKKAKSFLRQRVLVVRATVGGRNGLENAVVHEITQSRRQDVLCKAEVLLELAEAPQPIERVANDEQRPPVADRIERPRDRTARLFVTRAFYQADPFSEV